MLKLALTVLAFAVLGAAVAGTTTARAERVIYVGTYTGPESKGIYAFKFDDATGALTPVGLVAETPSPSFLESSADGRFVFAVNEIGMYEGERSGSVTAFSVDAATLKLTALNTVSSKGSSPCHLMLDRTGRFLAVANYGGGTFSLLPVGADGRLGAASAVLTNTGSGPNRQRQMAPHAHMVLFSADNRFLYGADLGVDRVHTYHFDAASGAVTPADPPGAAVAPGAGPRHLVLHPNGRLAFVINELDSTIATFARDAATGALTARATISTLPAGFTGSSSTAEIVLHPNGRFLYGSNRGHDSVAAYDVSATGDLRLVEIESTRGRTPRNFAIDPSGRWLIAANQATNTLAVFRIDASTGALEPAGPLASVPTPVSILFKP
jgi:6-phosphogluconolactonase